MKTPKKAPKAAAPKQKVAAPKITPGKIGVPVKNVSSHTLCSYCGDQPLASRDDAVSKRLLVFLEENAPAFQITWCQGCAVDRVEALGRVAEAQEAFKSAQKNFWTLMLPKVSK